MSKSTVVSFRLNNELYQRVRLKAERRNMSVPEYVRHLTTFQMQLDEEIKVKDVREIEIDIGIALATILHIHSSQKNDIQEKIRIDAFPFVEKLSPIFMSKRAGF